MPTPRPLPASIRGWLGGAATAFGAGLRDLLFPTPCLRCAGMGPQRLPGLCRECAWQLEPHPLAETGARWITACAFRGPVTQLVYALKYGGSPAAAVPLAAILAERIERADLRRRLDVLVPVPSHLLKRWSRGLDPAERIAEELALVSGLPVCRTVLVRVRATVAQAQASSAAERRRQVRGVFRVRRPHLLRDRRVGLVDDVVTSGATLGACRRELLRAGAGTVLALAVAGRAPPVTRGRP